MIMIGANGNKIAYGIKHYNFDTENDRKSMSTYNLTPGTTVFVIENSKQYMLNGSRKWVEINKSYTPAPPSDGDQDGGDVDDSENSGSGNGSYDGGDLDA